MEKICAVRIRSIIRANASVRRAVVALNLKKQNNCVILDKNPAIIGLLRQSEGVVTYGELNKETAAKLIGRALKQRGKKVDDLNAFIDSFFEGNAKLQDIGLKNLFRMHPPRGGFGRKGKSVPFKAGGSIGYRKEKINELLNRMM
ncbi:uL30 family ribosomal protein [Candidatus Parvarchaeota archaeon]|uniref:UL30 family ribosomal protein n=1 Tax=Candidatus Acidifodinimicrobium mancum TaxID=2898728 RepID=A0A8T3UST6_9ARCH|nr:uL30 family ribosomal protein [Candidatus Acidifodinimicrobium mancum]MBE5728383.1 uL30 family ribosomal protein [Candidatus Acidifodinimicrobium mancum]MBE5728948.1 uL30 family ribosomal protein [Candidatus Acidifodinimicrobium mancum]MBE5729925.1 uL30 family ribosomal protein [Candidatus Acidifodinimicrobium mancum]